MRVVIIGGGIVGLTSAYELRRAGADVAIVDAREVGSGASAVNAGWVCPAAAGPVPAPGMVRQAMRWMLRRDSPLYVRPSLDPSFLWFMLRMARHCNSADYRAGTQALLRLSSGTMELLDGYRHDGIDCEMHARGLLVAFLEAERLEAQTRDLDLATAAGLEPEVLDGTALREREPSLSEAVQGAIFYPHERHLDPAALARALRRHCLGLGVEIDEAAPLERVERRGGRVTEIMAGGRARRGDAFLLAAGAWSGALARQFGTALPVRPGKGYYLDLPRGRLDRPVYLSEARVAVTPFDDRLRLAGTMEFGGLDERVHPVRTRAIARAPARYLASWQLVAEPRAGAGLRPITPDGLPLMGQLPGLVNAFVSTGHATLGLTLAPASAVAMADLIAHDRRDPALKPFTPSRFAR